MKSLLVIAAALAFVLPASAQNQSAAEQLGWTLEVRSGLDPVDCLKKLEGRVIALHFKDLNETGLKTNDVPWGTGISNAKGMLAELKRQKFKGAICVEYEHNWGNSSLEIAGSAKWFNATCAKLVRQ